eukprot:CAMPEP_0177736132 /NCGR_PEP_ID=MMETSP0484_2-20121128/25161_1 /TAXON_ID=354590 /ORGANISM="Rhodomonas lens, Strain RHODO" /LENGTH=43 /DNA_ID= /DNA_START= /DNA_END= /DNA_ORIENTATION=
MSTVPAALPAPDGGASTPSAQQQPDPPAKSCPTEVTASIKDPA